VIKLTSNAVDAVTTVLSEDPEVEGKSLRVAVVGGGCSGYSYALDFDLPEDEDLVINYPGVDVCIDPHSAQLLKGTVIDYVDSTFKKGFTFTNPNATTTCGCGQSWG
jgi:iron-sulfur cluster assembly accessory protein